MAVLVACNFFNNQTSIVKIQSDLGSLLFLKGKLEREYKLISYERVLKVLKNDICNRPSHCRDISLQGGYPKKKSEN